MPRSNRRDPRWAAPGQRPATGPGARPAVRGARGAGAERSEAADLSWVLGPHHRREEGPDGDWHVREIGPGRSAKPYRCPGCDQLLPPGAPHVVAWPTDGLFGAEHAAGDRRHWHRSCWAARTRRRPR